MFHPYDRIPYGIVTGRYELIFKLHGGNKNTILSFIDTGEHIYISFNVFSKKCMSSVRLNVFIFIYFC